MKILIIGNGGREHTLAWKAAQSPQVEQVFVARGNAGTALEPKVTNIEIDPLDFPALIQFVETEHVDLTIVGPEAPLAAGIVNTFMLAGLPCLGPTKEAAQLESSKVFSKAFMQRHHIPTATYASFTDAEAAKAYVKGHAMPVVIKADGLLAGKGVVIAQNQSEAIAAIDSMVESQSIVIEEFLQGEEISFIVLSDGEFCLPLATSQDHKTRDEGDVGPNTGGMGAYSPVPWVTPELEKRILAEVIYPAVYGIEVEGHRYQGFLYAGLMITPDGTPKVLEFNCRLGDPETQVILPRLQSDFVSLCLATVERRLIHETVSWDPRFALGVVLASNGYPDKYASGVALPEFPQTDSQTHKIFHAGTKFDGENIVTHGGRVLCVTALAHDLATTQSTAYELIDATKWDGLFYRRDIGFKGLR